MSVLRKGGIGPARSHTQMKQPCRWLPQQRQNGSKIQEIRPTVVIGKMLIQNAFSPAIANIFDIINLTLFRYKIILYEASAISL